MQHIQKWAKALHKVNIIVSRIHIQIDFRLTSIMFLVSTHILPKELSKHLQMLFSRYLTSYNRVNTNLIFLQFVVLFALIFP